jgi:hypothetical protein
MTKEKQNKENKQTNKETNKQTIKQIQGKTRAEETK